MKLNRKEPEPVYFSKIIEDWMKEFPILTKYKKNQLYLRVGPFMIGFYFYLEYNEYHNCGEYYMYFAINPLWYTNDEIFGKANFSIQVEDMTYFKHSLELEDKSKSLNNKFGNIINFNVDLSYFVNVLRQEYSSIYKYYTYKENGHKQLNPHYLKQIAQIIEMELALATYIENEEWKNEIWKKIYDNVINKCDSDYLLTEGLTKHKWLEKLRIIVGNRENLIKYVELNSLRKEVANLIVCEFTGMDEFNYNFQRKKNMSKIKDKITRIFTRHSCPKPE